MSSQSTISEFLSSIAFRGRSILGIGSGQLEDANSGEIAELCQQLLSSKGDASGIALSNEILSRYNLLTDVGKATFFRRLRDDFSADGEELRAAAARYMKSPTQDNLQNLAAAAEPSRQQLISRLNQAPDATIHLLRMRADLLNLSRDEADLLISDYDFIKLFTSWFNGGFLQLRRLSWSSAASLLEKIMLYEAVHGMNDWQDLRARLDPPDREIYGFFHPRLGEEPLIFIEIALMEEMPSNIQDVLGANRKTVNPLNANTAVFYSISNCQHGLRGIPLGSFLIKRVVQDLQNIYPQLRQFVTLSPVNGYAGWLNRFVASLSEEAGSGDTDDVIEQLSSLRELAWIGDQQAIAAKTDAVMASAIRYFLNEKNSDGLPADPVARFHLGNGACLERINWPADTSSRALDSAFGIMVNYRYYLEDIENNHEKFSETGRVAISANLQKMARGYRKKIDQLSRLEIGGA